MVTANKRSSNVCRWCGSSRLTSDALRHEPRNRDRWTTLVGAATGLLVIASVSLGAAHAAAADGLERGFVQPPNEARLRAYWWWLNGDVTKTSITRDLEEMKAKGFGGALICDADGSSQDGNERAPHGPTFLSDEWRELFRHTLREAQRLGLEMSLNIQSGWNLGGPMVTPEEAPKKLVWTESRAAGPNTVETKLTTPKGRDGFYRDLYVLAFLVKPDGPKHRPLQNWEQKALLKPLVPFSAPDSRPLFEEFPAEPGEEDTHAAEVLDLTGKLGADGTLRWDVPEGTWDILRFGYTLNDHCRVSTCSQGWDGYALDPFDAQAFRTYWDAVVELLLADAGPFAGKTLKYLHTDSWEVEVANWTPTLRDEFRQRRGYDLLPYLPVIAGRIVDSRVVSDRFLNDFRRTMGDLAIANHYQLFRAGAHRHGLQIHPESGGPHAVPIDAQQCLGFNDAPMSEFWAWSWRHRVGDTNRFFVKQPASAAHAYGRKLVLAEGFTTIGPHWQETLWDNLKPSFDHALCEGLNLLVWHAFVCSPQEAGMPGIQYFAGTHLNPNSTWWSRSGPFFDYINRCQWMLQQGLFVADAAYYYGDHVPNFTQLKRTDPARVLPGYDYDVVTEEVVLTRMTVRDGRLVLPDGMSYRVLVLPDRTMISLPVLRKLRELVRAGATILGPKPVQASTLREYPQCDAEVARLAGELWTGGTGKGRVIQDKTAREVLLADGVRPDFEFTLTPEGYVSAVPAGTEQQAQSILLKDVPALNYLHRRVGDTDIYFVCNSSNGYASASCTFRVAGKLPELWDPADGDIRAAVAWLQADGRTTVPLEFPPYGSMFVVFRRPVSTRAAGNATENFPVFTLLCELSGPWAVQFDPAWGGPMSCEFDSLVSWTQRPEEGVKFYAGTATYRQTFDLPPSARKKGDRLWLDLGNVKELAEVRLNGRSLGIFWAFPFRADVTDALKARDNKLEVDVVNFWPNRIIGDQSLPPEKRFTKTNIRKLTRESPLMESGLLGPVTLQVARP
jgi:hypothetical protein